MSKTPVTDAVPEEGWLESLYTEIVSSPVNLLLLAAIVFLIYKIFKSRQEDNRPIPPSPPPLPKLRQDMTLQELRKYDGNDPTGRILVGVNGKIFDVTRGKRFYGPGGPYSDFAGHDASRAFALFQTDAVKEEYDDLSDLSPSEMEAVRDWEAQLGDKYDYVGKLLKPGEEPTVYEDQETDKPKSD